MARKSNKTEHVLNLLSGHETKEEPETEAEAAQAETPSSLAAGSSSNDTPGASASQTVSVIDTTEKDPLAELIQNKLSDEFEKQLSGDTPTDESAESAHPVQSEVPDTAAAQPQPDDQAQPDTSAASADHAQTSVQPSSDDQAQPDTSAASADHSQTSVQPPSDVQTQPAAQPAPADQAQPSEQMPAAEAKEDAQPQAAASQKDSEPQETSAAKAPAPEPDFVHVNVMERIVKEKIDYFMDQFEVCKCDRCRADSIALTLTGLQPRYIVTAPAAVDPLMSFFTNKYTADVIVEATKACMIVKEKPRH